MGTDPELDNRMDQRQRMDCTRCKWRTAGKPAHCWNNIADGANIRGEEVASVPDLYRV
jgi:hypothetical protein